MTPSLISALEPGLTRRTIATSALAALGGALLFGPGAAMAATQSELNRDGDATLQQLLGSNDKARSISGKARGILIFPKIAKAGFIVGGQGGEGVLKVGGRYSGYYSIAAGSFGLQAGVQKFSYVLFFMTQSALDYLKSSDGWAIGSGPSVVVADEGFAKSMNTTTLKKDVYAFPFGQKGLMAGMGLEGSKITPIHPKP
jgi:lipid-binding SYLF domain-containing protein